MFISDRMRGAALVCILLHLLVLCHNVKGNGQCYVINDIKRTPSRPIDAVSSARSSVSIDAVTKSAAVFSGSGICSDSPARISQGSCCRTSTIWISMPGKLGGYVFYQGQGTEYVLECQNVSCSGQCRKVYTAHSFNVGTRVWWRYIWSYKSFNVPTGCDCSP